MKKKLQTLIFILCIIHVSISTAQTNHRTRKIQLLDSVYQALYTSGSFNGNVLIAEKGRVLFEKSYGVANEATREKLKLKTIFELASVIY